MADTDKLKEEIAELKGESQIRELKVQALINILAKEGVIRKKDLDEELDSLCKE